MPQPTLADVLAGIERLTAAFKALRSTLTERSEVAELDKPRSDA
jgi:hypothetical protein